MSLGVRRLAVLDVAALTPLGDLEDTLAAIARGDIAGAPDPRDPQSGRIVAKLVAMPTASRHARIAGALPALAIEVARRASTGLAAGPRTGVFVAAGDLRAHWTELAPAMAAQTGDLDQPWTHGLSRLHPLWMLRYLSNAAHAVVAAELGFVGDGATFSGPAAAASALVAARAALDAGTIDHALVLALDDVTTGEAAIELAARRPDLVPGCAIAAMVVALVAPRPDGAVGPDIPGVVGAPSDIVVDAIDTVDPAHAEPSRATIDAARARLPAERDVAFHAITGWAGTATPLLDAIIATRLARRGELASATVTAAAAPGQLGVIRIRHVRHETPEEDR